MRLLEVRSFVLRSFRYGLVGILATILYVVSALAAIAVGITVFAAHIIAYTISVLASYIGQKIYTFEIESQHKRFGPRFIAATAFLAITQSLLVYGLSFYSEANETFIIAASTFYYLPVSFLVHTFWTFKGNL